VVVQVTVPVRMPGHAVTSISILSLHKSDMRLLHLAAKLGPLIAEAAQDVAVAMAEEQAEYDEQQQASTTGVLLIIWCQPAWMGRCEQNCVVLAIVKLECQCKQSFLNSFPESVCRLCCCHTAGVLCSFQRA